MNEDRLTLSAAYKDSTGSVDFSDLQIVDIFAGWITSNRDFKVVIFFNVKELDNCAR